MGSTIAKALAIAGIVDRVQRLVVKLENFGEYPIPRSENRLLMNSKLHSLPNQHPCTRPCHAPAACPESEPCEATITVTCSCGRIKQAIKCGRQISHPLGHQVTPPKCTRECNIAQRNAKLAEALGINPDSGAKDKATYNDEVVAFARNNSRFVPVVETAFSE